MPNFSAGLVAAALATTVGAACCAGTVQAESAGQNAGQSCPGNPHALGTSRVIAIDPSTYQRIGRMQYPDSLPLNDKEVVLTFDDGPLPPSSNKVLDALAAECVKVTYFLVGSMARAYPATVRRMYEEGHTIGTHSENHPSHFSRLPPDRLRQEIDGGIADVSAALGDSKYLAPFFRIPGLDRSEAVESALAARSLIVFSSDTVADDWHRGIKPNQIIALALKRLEARGKGILLLHDIHPTTAAALPGLLTALKDNGFHIVQVVPSSAYMIAMAAKPERKMLASAMPEQLKIGGDLDGTAAQPTWPSPAAEANAERSPDDIALPVPDVATFEPDSGVAEDNADVKWPELPPALSVTATPQAATRHGKKIAGGLERENAREREHGAGGQSRQHSGWQHAHRNSSNHADGSDHPADMMSRIKAFAAVFSPAQPAH